MLQANKKISFPANCCPIRNAKMSLKIVIFQVCFNCQRIYLAPRLSKTTFHSPRRSSPFRQFMAPVSMEHSVHSNLFSSACLASQHGEKKQPQKEHKLRHFIGNAFFARGQTTNQPLPVSYKNSIRLQCCTADARLSIAKARFFASKISGGSFYDLASSCSHVFAE